MTDILPLPFEWVEIPAGEVILEEFGKYGITPFAIAKYPVTNAQFQLFVNAADGYCNSQWWSFSKGATELRGGDPDKKPIDTKYPGDDLPRTTVSWYEAVAFCQWLSKRTGVQITLPTEQHWQRAAQGDDGRKYTWGNQAPGERLCNFDEFVGQVTPVTQYPDGASPFGVMDMSGNVWEWCLNDYFVPHNIDVSIDVGQSRRAVRGGCWNVNEKGVRVVTRYGGIPFVSYNDFGFRVCCVSVPG
ncbi:formylglycine-generating enzyme family protein [Chloroflexota bacterium]